MDDFAKQRARREADERTYREWEDIKFGLGGPLLVVVVVVAVAVLVIGLLAALFL